MFNSLVCVRAYKHRVCNFKYILGGRVADAMVVSA